MEKDLSTLVHRVLFTQNATLKLFFDPTGLDTDHQKRIPTWLKVKGSIPTSGVLLLPFCISLFPSSIHYIKEKHVILLQSNEAGLPS